MFNSVPHETSFNVIDTYISAERLGEKSSGWLVTKEAIALRHPSIGK